MVPILLRGGARLDINRIRENLGGSVVCRKSNGRVAGRNTSRPIASASHDDVRQALFPRLPIDAISRMIDFAFHVGFY